MKCGICGRKFKLVHRGQRKFCKREKCKKERRRRWNKNYRQTPGYKKRMRNYMNKRYAEDPDFRKKVNDRNREYMRRTAERRRQKK